MEPWIRPSTRVLDSLGEALQASETPEAGFDSREPGWWCRVYVAGEIIVSTCPRAGYRWAKREADGTPGKYDDTIRTYLLDRPIYGRTPQSLESYRRERRDFLKLVAEKEKVRAEDLFDGDFAHPIVSVDLARRCYPNAQFCSAIWASGLIRKK